MSSIEVDARKNTDPATIGISVSESSSSHAGDSEMRRRETTKEEIAMRMRSGAVRVGGQKRRAAPAEKALADEIRVEPEMPVREEVEE